MTIIVDNDISLSMSKKEKIIQNNEGFTVDELFSVVEKIQKKSNKNKTAKVLVDTAKQKWEQNSQYAF